MTKTELIKAAAAKSGLSKADTGKTLSAIMNSISEALAKEESVTLIGFGTFSVKERKARSGFNPATRKPIKIAASKVVKFKASASCKLK